MLKFFNFRNDAPRMGKGKTDCQFADLELSFFPFLSHVKIQLPRRLVMVLPDTPTISPTSEAFIAFNTLPLAS